MGDAQEAEDQDDNCAQCDNACCEYMFCGTGDESDCGSDETAGDLLGESAIQLSAEKVEKKKKEVKEKVEKKKKEVKETKADCWDCDDSGTYETAVEVSERHDAEADAQEAEDQDDNCAQCDNACCE